MDPPVTVETTKRELSLDFSKPTRYTQPQSLVTPILAISTPELNKMISSNDDLTLLTPNGISSVIPNTAVILPSPLIPTTVNNCDNIINNQSGNENSSQFGDYDDQNIDQQQQHHHHHQQQNNQRNLRRSNYKDSNKFDSERVAKKRERNRLAAKKCRQKKIETIDGLRKTVSKWESDYKSLKNEFERYKVQATNKIEQLTLENTELRSRTRLS